VIRAGVGFSESLALAGLDPQIIPHIVDRLSPALDFRRLRAGDRFTVVLNPDGDLVSLTYEKSPLEALVLRSTPGGWETELEALPTENRIVEVRGNIRSSLFEAMDRAGENELLTLAFAELFAWDIDFAHELQPGDSFRVVVEKVYRDRRFVQYGRILAAEYRQSDETHQAYFFPWPDERGEYYTAEGRSVRASFLRSPISYTRISSGFSGARLHPILNKVRPLMGVDFAAPEGTPVWAPADGVVIARTRDAAGGNRIALRHGSGYETHYLHLSRFATGLSVGDRVQQKEVIGYVGSTGLATGPHLDYRVRRNEAWVNPVTEAFPRAERLPEQYAASFAEYRAWLDGQAYTPLEGGTNLASSR
jgi:murein DD-endopeptidase MepM/ murein hydrolase activator NlpD